MDKNTSDVELDGAEIFSNWSQLVQTDEVAQKQNTANTDDVLDMALDNLALDGGDAHWLEVFQKTNLSDMDLVALPLIRHYEHDFKAEYQQMKNQTQVFLANLVRTHVNELRVAGLSEEQISNLKEGQLPVNWTVHLKYPLMYGGTITVDNLVLIPHHPFHEDLHHFINRQMVTDAGVMSPAVLYVPAPKTAVYIPYGSSDMAEQVTRFQQGGLK